MLPGLDRRLWIALGALSFLGMQCGPTSEEVGGGVLIASPLVILVSASLLTLLGALWLPLRPGLQQDFRPTLWAAGALACLAVLGLSAGGPDAPGLAMLAIWIFGSSHAALTLVIFRIWFAWSPSRALSWAGVPAMVLMVVPALVLLGQGNAPAGDAIAIWIIPGYMGAVPAVIYLALILEAVLRRRGQARVIDPAE